MQNNTIESIFKVPVVSCEKEIKSILPHKGSKLLLDGVEISDERIVGKFKVTPEVCEGHAVFDGKPVFKGSDFLDMAAQLLGIWIAKNPNFSYFNYSRCLVRSYGRSVFYKPAFVGEILVIEIDCKNVKVKAFLKEGKNIIIVIGNNFVVSSNYEKKAYIESVEIIVAS